MCRTMNELEKVVADYRSLKALKEQLEEELKAVEREIIGYMDTNEKVSEIGNNFTIKLSTCERKTLDNKRLEALQSIRELASTADYTLNKVVTATINRALSCERSHSYRVGGSQKNRRLYRYVEYL